MIHFNMYHPDTNFFQLHEISALQTPFAYLEYNLGGRMFFELLKKTPKMDDFKVKIAPKS